MFTPSTVTKEALASLSTREVGELYREAIDKELLIIARHGTKIAETLIEVLNAEFRARVR